MLYLSHTLGFYQWICRYKSLSKLVCYWDSS